MLAPHLVSASSTGVILVLFVGVVRYCSTGSLCVSLCFRVGLQHADLACVLHLGIVSFLLVKCTIKGGQLWLGHRIREDNCELDVEVSEIE